MPRPSLLLGPLALLLGAAPALAQGPVFRTPGMPGTGIPGTPFLLGQTNRFSNDFNPALGFVIDSILDWTDLDAPGAEEGFDANLRLLEFTGAAWIDPNAFAYLVVTAEGGESLGVEEAAVNYLGLPGHLNVKAGRFFVDFGKQMQSHVHDLRTVERPLVLRTYLGEELAGEGFEIGNWHAVGEKSALRYTFGVFGNSLLPGEHEHGHEEEEGPEAEVEDRKKFSELNFTGRVTAFRDLGPTGILQAGASARYVPEYAAVDPTGTLDSLTGLDSTVFGLDLTYGWTNDTGVRRATVGLEWLWSTGDSGIAFDDPEMPTEIRSFDETVSGFYAFFDYGFDQFNSAGLQWSQVQLPQAGKPKASELDLYYSRGFSEFQRLRLALTLGENDAEQDGDYVRVALQYTAFLGAHSHGINW